MADIDLAELAGYREAWADATAEHPKEGLDPKRLLDFSHEGALAYTLAYQRMFEGAKAYNSMLDRVEEEAFLANVNHAWFSAALAEHLYYMNPEGSLEAVLLEAGNIAPATHLTDNPKHPPESDAKYLGKVSRRCSSMVPLRWFRPVESKS